MPSSYSSLKIELIATGEQTGTWGATTNTNLGTALEEAIVGRATADFTSDANLTLTLANSNATQVARNLVLNVTSSFGNLTATRDLVVPAIQKPYIVQNNTSGSQSIRVIVGAGSVTVPNGKTVFIYNDGTNIKSAFDFVPDLQITSAVITSADINGGTIDGASVGASSPSSGAFTTFSATQDGTFSGTGQLKLPTGTTAQRTGSPSTGLIRFNTTTTSFEGYDGSAWGNIGGGAEAGGAIVVNNDIASISYTIASGENGFSVGPMTVSSGVTITVSSGQRWVVI